MDDGWMDGWIGGWMDGWMDWWMDGWIGGWMDGLVDGWMDGWMDWWVGGQWSKCMVHLKEGTWAMRDDAGRDLGGAGRTSWRGFQCA